MRLRPALLSIAALSLGAFSACAPDTATEEVDYRVPVAAREVVAGTVEDLIVATGTLRPPEVASLTVENEGVLRIGRSGGRRLAEGDQVSAGQLIAEITGEDVRVAARLDATRQRHATTLVDFESKRRLFAEGLITKLELQQAESALADAQAELDRSVLTNTQTQLVTPVAGVITKLARDASGRPLADGQRVSPGVLVAEVAPLRTLIADLDIVGADVSKVKPGQSARVRQLAFEDQRFEGRVARLAPTQDVTTRASRAECEVDNAQGLLRPGMFVEVSIVIETRENVPVVPREAVTEREGRTSVFVLEGQKAFLRPVTQGLGDDRVVEIREGIELGERVVVRGLETLTDGTRVRDSGE